MKEEILKQKHLIMSVFFVAALFLTTEAVVADKPEKDAGGGMPGGGMEDY